MIPAPWNIVFTVLFVGTAALCVVHISLAPRHARPAWRRDVIADIGHIAMSAAMILMTWVMMIPTALNIAQLVVFSGFAVYSLGDALTRSTLAARLDQIAHAVLHAAMVWMIAAMPLLMGGSDTGHDAHEHDGHTHDHSGEMTSATASCGVSWVDIVNVAFVSLSFAVAVWWVVRALRRRHHVWHALCHAGMAVGMGAMLLAMNG